MSILTVLSGPLIGGAIGYVTNYLAIKMLFRPAEPIYIGRFRLPFTPGVVPRRKDQLAEILGGAIVKKFFNAGDLEVIFTSDYLCGAFADSLLDLLCREEGTVADLLPEGEEDIEERLKEALCVRMTAGVLRSGLAERIAREGGKILEKTAVLGSRSAQDLAALLAAPLAGRLEEYLLLHGRELLLPILDEELRELSGQPTRELVETLIGDPAALRRILYNGYQKFMAVYVRQIVETIDVGGMITEKVKLMSAAEIEGLVLDVVKRELNDVIWLGAALGMVIGVLNIWI